LENRKKIIRTHNIEHDYYGNLARVERNVFKRYYFYNEAGKLKKYEQVLRKADAIAAISENDAIHFRKMNPVVKTIPAFHPFSAVDIKPGRGTYAFYHGNLSVGENNEAALYLVNRIFNDLSYPLVIAGNKPSEELKKAVRMTKNVTLYEYLTPEKIHELIRDAQCNVLPTFQATGIKLKLLAALHAGRTCIVNGPMVENTGLESLCIQADTPDEMKKEVIRAMSLSDFPLDEVAKRRTILEGKFSNKVNAGRLIGMFD
jgi:glycosyltransferase involved in cell wall biosynthesis